MYSSTGYNELLVVVVGITAQLAMGRGIRRNMDN
jgi:hypothetical protein